MMKKYCNIRVATLAVLMLLSGMVCSAWAQGAASDSDVPAVSMVYPSASGDKVADLKSGVKAYVYFAGAKIVEAKGSVWRDDNRLGVLTYDGAYNSYMETWGTSATMDPAKECNAFLNDIGSGLFTIKIYEVTYIASDGTQKVYSDEANPLAVVTYNRPDYDGKLVSSTGLEDKKMLSYYPADAAEGVKTYTFSKALSPNKLKGYLLYGYNDLYTFPLELKLSDDATTITVDLRGVCHNVATLAPGVTFVDDSGSPVDPPSTITIVLEGLECTDGTQITTTASSIDGAFSHVISRQLYDPYYYFDITFDTPVLAKGEFYSSATPSVHYASILPGTDMMELEVKNAEVITTADIELRSGSIVETVAAADITRSGELMTFALPESIYQAGSNSLIASLVNIEYNVEDGAVHVVKPLDFSNVAHEVTTLAALKEYDAGMSVVLDIEGGLMVTLANDYGYCFAEDAADGIEIQTPDYSKAFEQGTLIKGKLAGTYMGYGVLMLNAGVGAYTAEPVDVTFGTELDAIADVYAGMYDCRLVTFRASEELPIEVVGGNIVVDTQLPVMTDFAEGFKAPDEVLGVTGVVYRDSASKQRYICIRSAADVVGNTSGIGIETTEVNANGDVYDLRGVRVRTAGETLDGLHGVFIVSGKKIQK